MHCVFNLFRISLIDSLCVLIFFVCFPVFNFFCCIIFLWMAQGTQVMLVIRKEENSFKGDHGERSPLET